MSELAERARELAEEVIHETKFVDVVESAEIVRLIEQALLAERRLAMEEAAKMCDERRDPDCFCDACDECTAMAQALRAAAEKEGL